MSFGKNWWTSRTLRQTYQLRDASTRNTKLGPRQFGICVSSWAWEIASFWNCEYKYNIFDDLWYTRRSWRSSPGWVLVCQKSIKHQTRKSSTRYTHFDSSRREALVTCLSQCRQPRFPWAENWNSSGSCSIRTPFFWMPWGPENCYGLMILCVESMEIQLAKKVGIFPSDFFSWFFRGIPCTWFRPKISMLLRRQYWQMLLLPRAQRNQGCIAMENDNCKMKKWGKMRKEMRLWKLQKYEDGHEVVHSPFLTFFVVFFLALTSFAMFFLVNLGVVTSLRVLALHPTTDAIEILFA